MKNFDFSPVHFSGMVSHFLSYCMWILWFLSTLFISCREIRWNNHHARSTQESQEERIILGLCRTVTGVNGGSQFFQHYWADFITTTKKNDKPPPMVVKDSYEYVSETDVYDE